MDRFETSPAAFVSPRAKDRARSSVGTPLRGVGVFAARGAIRIRILMAAVVVAPVLASTPAVSAENPATPPGGPQPLDLTERWRIGEDDEEIIGMVQKARFGPDGDLFILDRQLAQVQVYSPSGEHLRTLSREGEGPGEVRRPADLLFFPDGSLGLMQQFPGKVVRIDTDGTPRDSYTPDPATETGGFLLLHDGAQRGGTIVFSGTESSPAAEGERPREQFLAAFDAEGAEVARFLTRRTTTDFMQRWIEKEQDSVQGGRWTLGPDGRVFVAPERDRYEIQVFRPDGTLERTIRRAYEPMPRTAEEKEELKGSVLLVVNGRRVEPEMVLEDNHPCIVGMFAEEDGELWVLTGRGRINPPDGVLETWDVFDPDGRFVRSVALRGDGDTEHDRLVRIDDTRWLLLSNYLDTARAMGGGRGGDAEDDEDATDEPFTIALLEGRP